MKIAATQKLAISTAIFILVTCCTRAQTYMVNGTVKSMDSIAVASAAISIQKYKGAGSAITDSNGFFKVAGLVPGKYVVTVNKPGFTSHIDSVTLVDKNLDLGLIILTPFTHELKEVSVVEKILAMVQKDDTLEFNSGAYKINPDADAADLIKKLPSLAVRNNRITAQGEDVVKILIDGKPFFGNDPYNTLRLLPAGIIAKVQVYNEKSEQEQFTGFSEGQTSKTINIVTKPGKRNGVFGKLYAGTGGDENTTRYGTGADINHFNGDTRITATAHSDNLNATNFTDPNPTASGGSGYTTNTAAAINHTDKWGKKTDWNGSYAFDDASNSNQKTLIKNYTIPSSYGQVYRENNTNYARTFTHRVNMGIYTKIDSLNTLNILPQLSFQNSNGNTQRAGNTTDSLGALNAATNRSVNHNSSHTINGNLLYGHRFRIKGRSISLNLNANDNATQSTTLLQGSNTYFRSPLLSDTVNQQTIQNQVGSNYSGNITYTNPAGKEGQLKATVDINFMPSKNERNTYNYADATTSYSVKDTLLSNTLTNTTWNSKAGFSYRRHVAKHEISLGLHYQLASLQGNTPTVAGQQFERNYQNILPVTAYKYKFSRNSNIQINYSTYTRAPSVTQLQNVVINADPLHLSTGNPDLVQPYTHNLIMRYNYTSKNAQNSVNCSVGGYYTTNTISTNVIIADKDTLLMQRILLPKGSQLSIPVNTSPSTLLNSNAGYSMPLAKLKCLVNFTLNADYSRIPAIINNVVNYQNRTNGAFSIAINSNISENIDFTVTSNTAVVASNNSLHNQTNATYFNQGGTGTVNLILPHGIVFNTGITYQANYGLSAGYNQNFVVWNLSAGKKLFKKQQGDIRISAFDLLNNNNSIQHTVTETYVQDSRNNILQRYILLTFSYKLRDFH